MGLDFNKMQASLEAETSVTQSAIALMTSLSEQIRAAGTDQVKLNELADKLDTQKSALAAAVVANTVASSEPPAEPAQPAEPVSEAPAGSSGGIGGGPAEGTSQG